MIRPFFSSSSCVCILSITGIMVWGVVGLVRLSGLTCFLEDWGLSIVAVWIRGVLT